MRRLVTYIVTLFFVQVSFAQFPFAGIQVEEITMVGPGATNVEAALPGARCFRVYLCFDDPSWELLSVAGEGAPFPELHINLQGGASFYQNGFGGPTSLGVLPILLPTFPELEYDSFVTIGSLDNVGNNLQVATINAGWASTFEAGGDLDIDYPIGTSWYVTNPPIQTQNRPDGNNQVLLFQLTTDGTFTGVINFLIREVDGSGAPVLPVNSLLINQVQFNNIPGQFDNCAIMFLPVELVSFEATPTESTVELKWITESETNNDYFTVERSTDGFIFEEVVRMPGAGTTTNTQFYNTRDTDPIEGVSYYRLKQTDYNGDFEYSDLVPVEFYKSDNSFTIFPNPVTGDYLNIAGKHDILQSISLYSAEGRLILTKNSDLNASLYLGDVDLVPGVYFLEFKDRLGNTQQEKLVIR